MRMFIESIEIIKNDNSNSNADFIQQEIPKRVKYKNVKSIFKKHDVLQLKKEFSLSTETKILQDVKKLQKRGKVYKQRKHYCYHEEGLPCVVEEL